MAILTAESIILAKIVGTKFWINLEIIHHDRTFVLSIENGAFVTNWNTFFFTIPIIDYSTNFC